jgi:hypothetical protein
MLLDMRRVRAEDTCPRRVRDGRPATGVGDGMPASVSRFLRAGDLLRCCRSRDADPGIVRLFPGWLRCQGPKGSVHRHRDQDPAIGAGLLRAGRAGALGELSIDRDGRQMHHHHLRQIHSDRPVHS